MSEMTLIERLVYWAGPDDSRDHQRTDIAKAADEIKRLCSALRRARNLIGPDEIIDAVLASGLDRLCGAASPVDHSDAIHAADRKSFGPATLAETERSSKTK